MRTGWLSADSRDNDPAVFLAYLAVALDRVDSLEPNAFGPMASPGTAVTEVIRLAASLHDPIALILDNAEAITNPESRDMIAGLLLRLPRGSFFAIGSRHEPPVPMSRLRAEGVTLELGVGELAMTRPEARRLLDVAGVALADHEVDDLVARTEGWPAGLYLAALALNAGGSHVDVAEAFTGGHRFMGDYLRSEFLDRVSRSDVSFLVRTSILERLNGSLCDAVVGTRRSARVLDRLERSNLLVIPLDHRGEWYRYHHLFRDLLRAELQRREPEMVTDLHIRAATWYEANGISHQAIAHAQLAGDADRVARLVLNAMTPTWASGRLETVLSWIEWFPPNGRLEDHPAIAVHGALIYALIGNAGDAARWAAAADRATSTGILPDGNTVEGTLAYLRTLMCRNGTKAMALDAESALAGLGPISPYRPAMLHALGCAHLLGGELGPADAYFVRAIDEATSAGMVPFLALLVTERGLVATERKAWGEAEALARTVSSMMDGQYDDYWTSALAYSWRAQVAVRRGDPTAARQFASRAARLRPLLTYALPVVSVRTLVELARAYVMLADPGGAAAVLGQADEILQHCSDLGTLADEASDLHSKLEALRVEMAGASTLTTAELRLLPLLSTHLTLAEIAGRLFVSRATVKAQSLSVYRKLGVSSRGDAIARLQDVGLVPSP